MQSSHFNRYLPCHLSVLQAGFCFGVQKQLLCLQAVLWKGQAEDFCVSERKALRLFPVKLGLPVQIGKRLYWGESATLT